MNLPQQFTAVFTMRRFMELEYVKEVMAFAYMTFIYDRARKAATV